MSERTRTTSLQVRQRFSARKCKVQKNAPGRISRRNRCLKRSPTSRKSSTTSTSSGSLTGLPPPWLRHCRIGSRRQPDDEGGTIAVAAFDLKRTFVILRHNLVAQAEPQPGAAVLPCERNVLDGNSPTRRREISCLLSLAHWRIVSVRTWSCVGRSPGITPASQSDGIPRWKFICSPNAACGRWHTASSLRGPP